MIGKVINRDSVAQPKVVSSILEDQNGNLWFGTDGGVSRYDGESSTHFTEKEGLSNNSVLSMFEDRSENLWFGTNGGVSLHTHVMHRDY